MALEPLIRFLKKTPNIHAKQHKFCDTKKQRLCQSPGLNFKTHCPNCIETVFKMYQHCACKSGFRQPFDILGCCSVLLCFPGQTISNINCVRVQGISCSAICTTFYLFYLHKCIMAYEARFGLNKTRGMF